MMLEYFKHWPRKQIALYSESVAHSATTGVMTTTYALRELRYVWVFTTASMQRYLAGKVIDENQFVAISETAVVATDVIYMDGEWYRTSVDNISFFGEVYQVVMQRIEKPVYTGTLPTLVDV